MHGWQSEYVDAINKSDIRGYCVRQLNAKFTKMYLSRQTYAGGICNLGSSCYSAVCLQMLGRSAEFLCLLETRFDPLSSLIKAHMRLMHISNRPTPGAAQVISGLGLNVRDMYDVMDFLWPMLRWLRGCELHPQYIQILGDFEALHIEARGIHVVSMPVVALDWGNFADQWLSGAELVFFHFQRSLLPQLDKARIDMAESIETSEGLFVLYSVVLFIRLALGAPHFVIYVRDESGWLYIDDGRVIESSLDDLEEQLLYMECSVVMAGYVKRSIDQVVSLRKSLQCTPESPKQYCFQTHIIEGEYLDMEYMILEQGGESLLDEMKLDPNSFVIRCTDGILFYPDKTKLSDASLLLREYISANPTQQFITLDYEEGVVSLLFDLVCNDERRCVEFLKDQVVMQAVFALGFTKIKRYCGAASEVEQADLSISEEIEQKTEGSAQLDYDCPRALRTSDGHRFVLQKKTHNRCYYVCQFRRTAVARKRQSDHCRARIVYNRNPWVLLKYEGTHSFHSDDSEARFKNRYRQLLLHQVVDELSMSDLTLTKVMTEIRKKEAETHVNILSGPSDQSILKQIVDDANRCIRGTLVSSRIPREFRELDNQPFLLGESTRPAYLLFSLPRNIRVLNVHRIARICCIRSNLLPEGFRYLFVALTIRDESVEPAFWLITCESSVVVWKCVFACLRSAGLASAVPRLAIIGLSDDYRGLRRAVDQREIIFRAPTDEYRCRIEELAKKNFGTNRDRRVEHFVSCLLRACDVTKSETDRAIAEIENKTPAMQMMRGDWDMLVCEKSSLFTNGQGIDHPVMAEINDWIAGLVIPAKIGELIESIKHWHLNTSFSLSGQRIVLPEGDQ